MTTLVSDYKTHPHRMLLDLADLAGRAGNERLRRVWMANYLRVADEKR